MRNLRSIIVRFFLVVSTLLLTGAADHDSAMSDLLLALVILLPVAKLAGLVAEKLTQPAVMGELFAGLILGNLSLLGLDGLDFLKADAALEILAQLGVILLLFEIGLDASLADLMKVGLSSLLVALIGVLLPFLLGWLVSAWLLPDRSFYVHTFIGATLCATSVGITARVLQDINAMRTPEAKIILGASVIDDVLGLLILAVVSGMILGADQGSPVSVGSITYLVVTAIAFLAGSLFVGVRLLPHIFHHAAKPASRGMLFTLSLTLCFLMSYLSATIGLSPIVGAFAAGLILESVPMEKYLQAEELSPIKCFIHYLRFLCHCFSFRWA